MDRQQESSTSLHSQIMELEIRLAHQDRQIAELNEVITEQWRVIDQLSRQMAQMREDMLALQVPREGPEPPPPHY
ncbi:MAG: SlyX family protein [Alphaproteobacteria bacterium]|nr:SlyX family protein [Alphaproteobacteria bacterium]